MRRALQKMVENEIIKVYPIVNPYACGFTEYYLMFSFAARNAAVKSKALNVLQKSPEVAFLGEFGGHYQYGADIYARGPLEIVRILDQLSSQMGPILLDKRVATVISMTYFVPKYLSRKAPKIPILTYGAYVPVAKLDELDHRILHALMAPGYSNQISIARELGIPNTTLDYRIKSLKDRKILAGMVYFLNSPQMLGLHSYSLLVYLNQSSSSLRKRIFDYCASHQRVHYLGESLGGADFEIGARFDEAHHVSTFVDELSGAFEKEVNSVTHFPFLQRFKLKLYPLGAFAPEK